MTARGLIILSGALALAACTGPLGLPLGGGGPNVAANVQAGKTNSQTVGTTTVNEQKLVRPKARTINQTADANKVNADRIENMQNNTNEAWLIIAFAAALFLDSPLRWPGQIWQAIKRWRDNE